MDWHYFFNHADLYSLFAACNSNLRVPFFYFDSNNRMYPYVHRRRPNYLTLPVGREKSFETPPSLRIVSTDVEVVRGPDESTLT